MARLVEGRADGPVRTECEVLMRRRSGSYWSMTLSAREIAERARPGQFVEVAVEARDTLLRRPFSIARVSSQGPSAGTIEIVFDAHGPGTRWLADVAERDAVDVVGPLGSAFPMPQHPVAALLIGGGYGVAPMFFLGDQLTRANCRVDMIVGAASADRIHDAIESKRMSASVTFTTEDGSMGQQGRVTDVMPDLLTSNGTDVVYACGPNPMLKAVAEIAREHKVPCLVAVEEYMACGIGACWTCVMPIRGKDGHVRNKRSCVDGPVFNGARIAWEHTRWGVQGAADE